MKRNYLFLSLCALLVGCNETKASENKKESEATNISETVSLSEEISESSNIEISSSSEVVDYGEVYFSNVTLYSKFEAVHIEPIFSNLEISSSEIFEYTIDNEDICYEEDGFIYYLNDGKTTIHAKSAHFKKTFSVNCKSFDKPYATINSAKKVDKNTTLFIGDSFFEFWRNGTNIETKFSDVFKDYNVCNIGISATTTHHWRAMLNEIYENCPENPKNIVINIGINNVDDDKEIGTVAAYNIESLLLDLNYYFPESNLYYFSITHSTTFSYLWEHHEKSNTLVKEFCEKYNNMNYLDVMELYGETTYQNYLQDGLHPNQQGYNFFEQLIKGNVPMEEK